MSTTTHHCENGSWFLDPQCLHHLEHVHHSLGLAALDGGGNGTEHTRAANSITVQREKMEKEVHIYTKHEENNENDPRAVAVLKDSIVVGHLPRQSAC